MGVHLTISLRITAANSALIDPTGSMLMPASRCRTSGRPRGAMNQKGLWSESPGLASPSVG